MGETNQTGPLLPAIPAGAHSHHETHPSAVRGRLGIVLALLAVYVIWGSTYLAIRFTLESFPPFLMAGARFLLAGCALFVIARASGTPAPLCPRWGGAALVGGLLLVTGNGVVTFAEQWVSSSLTALLLAVVPIWAALMAGIWGQWPARIEWLGLLLGFGGIVLLNLESDLRANPLGAALLVLATLSWALGSVWSRRLPLPTGVMASAAEMIAAGAMLSTTSLALGEHMAAPPTTRALLAFVYLIVFGAIVAFSAYGYLLRRARPALATSYAYVNPVVAVALGVGLAGERIGSLGLLAMVIILAGVGLVMFGKKRDR
jgi:drug/metabolite transporter (DMT)-like permease